MGDVIRYKTIVTCPVCNALFDEITHPDAEPNAMGMAMLLGECRRKHLKVSSDCKKDARWYEGWKTVTQKIKETQNA